MTLPDTREDVRPWTPAEFGDEDADDPGITLTDFCRAISIWSAMQGRSASVAETALTFNTTPDVVQSAVKKHGGFYLFLGGDDANPSDQTIEHDGE
jgi:hypothetical protein